MNKKKAMVTVNQLSKKTKVDRATIVKRLEEKNVKPEKEKNLGNRTQKHFDAMAALDAIGESSRNGRHSSSQDRLNTARAIQIEAENEEKNRLQSRELMRTEDVVNILKMGVNKIDQVMPRLAAEFGLAADVVATGQKYLDEAREAWAREIGDFNK